MCCRRMYHAAVGFHQEQLAEAESSGKHEEERALQQREWEQRAKVGATISRQTCEAVLVTALVAGGISSRTAACAVH